MMKGFLRLYPDSPIVSCGYDERTRMLEHFPFRLGQPAPMFSRRDKYEDNLLFDVYYSLFSNPKLIYGCCFNADYAVYVDRTGAARAEALFKKDDYNTIVYVNSFEGPMYFPNDPYYKTRILPTYTMGNLFYTEPAFEIYFPGQDLCFDGTHYYQPKEVPQALEVSPDEIRDLYLKTIGG